MAQVWQEEVRCFAYIYSLTVYKVALPVVGMGAATNDLMLNAKLNTAG